MTRGAAASAPASGWILHRVPGGAIYGLADRRTFFVFDPVKRVIIQQRSLVPELGETVSQQGPRPFVAGPSDETFLLLRTGIARIDPQTHEVTLLVRSPKSIDAGGDHLDGHIYFVSGSHLCSYALPKRP
jgi:hypothetical protein